MTAFLLRKLINTIFIIFGVITLSFALVRLIPGNPARVQLGQRADEASIRALEEAYGFDKPMIVQYGLYLKRLMQGDMGRSISTNRPVLETLMKKMEGTALLSSVSMLLATILGIALGVLAAVRANTWMDTVFMGIAQFGIAVPSFVMASLFILLFGVYLDWFPISGYVDRGAEYLVLPALALGIRPLAIIARVTRSSMLDVMGHDYIRTAKAKGLNSFAVTMRHTLRNALNPVVTTTSTWFASLLSGAYFIEYMFNWEGVGKVSVDSLSKLDYPLLQGACLIFALILVLINFLSDVLYSFLDPRVKIA